MQPPTPEAPQGTAEAARTTSERATQEGAPVLKHLCKQHIREITTETICKVEVGIGLGQPGIVLPERQEGALSDNGSHAEQIQRPVAVAGGNYEGVDLEDLPRNQAAVCR